LIFHHRSIDGSIDGLIVWSISWSIDSVRS